MNVRAFVSKGLGEKRGRNRIFGRKEEDGDDLSRRANRVKEKKEKERGGVN